MDAGFLEKANELLWYQHMFRRVMEDEGFTEVEPNVWQPPPPDESDEQASSA